MNLLGFRHVVFAAALVPSVALPVMAHASAQRCERVFAVTHLELTTGSADVAPAGPSIGDTHSFRGPVYRPGTLHATGSIAGVGTTAAIDDPVPGSETRSVQLAFALPDLASQITVGGFAVYPMTSSTLARNSVTLRPITGGTGRFTGARGYLRTTHFARGYFRQEFHLVQACQQ
ncbi:MAG: hypothetical protein NT143_01855 [Actinobacteria bacterium]|nr:hypothetical protein [Actinomycetota bacterium]